MLGISCEIKITFFDKTDDELELYTIQHHTK